MLKLISESLKSMFLGVSLTQVLKNVFNPFWFGNICFQSSFLFRVFI